jgi:hypothetical protein
MFRESVGNAMYYSKNIKGELFTKNHHMKNETMKKDNKKSNKKFLQKIIT